MGVGFCSVCGALCGLVDGRIVAHRLRLTRAACAGSGECPGPCDNSKQPVTQAHPVEAEREVVSMQTVRRTLAEQRKLGLCWLWC